MSRVERWLAESGLATTADVELVRSGVIAFEEMRSLFTAEMLGG